ncbi:MAG: hypothetical protein ACOYEW_06330 [Anaerolineae bacterium]
MEERPESDAERQRRRAQRPTPPDLPRTDEEPVGVYNRPGGLTSTSGGGGRALAVILALLVLVILVFLLIQFVL